MRWVVLGLFLFGLVFVVWGCWEARQDALKGQSADVAMGDEFLKEIGYAIWLLDVAVGIVWVFARVFF